MNVKERVLSYMQETAEKPVRMETIMNELQLNGEEVNELPQALAELENEKIVFQNRKGKFGLPKHFKWVEGRISITSKGTGFVIPDVDGKDGQPRVNDIFIPADQLNSAMNGDRVIVRITSYGGGAGGLHREGAIVAVMQRANKRIVGTYEKSRTFGFVVPDDTRLNQEIYIDAPETMGAEVGTKVVVEVTKWPTKKNNAEGRIAEVLGKAGDPGVDVLSVMRQYDLDEHFPEDAAKEAAGVEQVPDTAEYAGRKDRRDLPIVTIDGEDAKDLDDGVYAKRLDNGNYFLGVYIADVSHYVKPGSPLDREAYKRGTSVYLADRVVPMLPVELSNGICSLNAGTDRLSMCAEMEIDGSGTVVRAEIAPAVIHVYRRLTYNLVNKILVDKDEQIIQDNADLLPLLQNLREVREILYGRRQKRGSIDFDIPEIKAKLDENGRTVALVKREHGLGESIVEECMLAANETTAEYMARKNLPFVYRIHEKPAEEKMDALQQLLAAFSLHLNRNGEGEIEPGEIQRVLNSIAGKPEEKIISAVALRSMQQAKYSPENMGHFGLAAEYYTHFTSPIRRYPDLMVHRLLKAELSGRLKGEEAQKKWRSRLPEITAHTSKQERIAVEAERDTLMLKEIEYMARFVGQTFAGVISGVTSFGIFVELENGVEGLVHISTMVNDYYEYVQSDYALIGENSRVRYQLGESVSVILTRASLKDRAIDFVLADNNPRYVSPELEKLEDHIIAVPVEPAEKEKTSQSQDSRRKKGGRNAGRAKLKNKDKDKDRQQRGRGGRKSAEKQGIKADKSGSGGKAKSLKAKQSKRKKSEKPAVQEIKLKKLGKPEPFFFDIYAKKAQELSLSSKEKAQTKNVRAKKTRRKRTTMK